MFTLTRLTGMVIVLICTIGIFVCASGAEAIIAYSGPYTIDLEQKQMLLSLISEDALRTEDEFKAILEKEKSIQDEMIGHLSIDKINLAEIMPIPYRIDIAMPRMSNTLAPERASKIQTYEKKKALR